MPQYWVDNEAFHLGDKKALQATRNAAQQIQRGRQQKRRQKSFRDERVGEQKRLLVKEDLGPMFTGFTKGGEPRPARFEMGERPYPALRNLENTSGSACFMDSVLTAMFGPSIVYMDERANSQGAFPADGFWRVMIYEDIEPRLRRSVQQRGGGLDKVCSRNVERDIAIRKKVQAVLRADYEKLAGRTREDGVRINCSVLRDILGRECGQDFRRGVDDVANYDMSETHGYQDAIMLYKRLASVFEFYPVAYHEKRSYGYFIDGEFEPVYESISERVSDILRAQAFLVDVSDLFQANAGWDVLPNGEEEPTNRLNDTEDTLAFAWEPANAVQFQEDQQVEALLNGALVKLPYNLLGTFRIFDNGDPLVFEVRRIFKSVAKRYEPNTPDSDLPEFDQYIGVPDEITQNVFATNNVQPSDPITSVPREQVTFRLLSAVIHRGESIEMAHYRALVRVPRRKGLKGDDWYLYDDLGQNGKIVSDEAAKRMYCHRTTLLFYFPWTGPTNAPTEPTAAESPLDLRDMDIEDFEQPVIEQPVFKQSKARIIKELLGMGFTPEQVKRAVVNASTVDEALNLL